MLIEVQVKANAGGGKTAVSRVIEKALRDAGFTVTNYDADVALQTDLDAAVKNVTERHSIDIVTKQAPRSWLFRKPGASQKE